MTEQGSPRLFISHPSSKADTALHIERALNARGVDCWIAPRDIEPGEQWDIAIHRAIGATDAMLLLFCEDSDRSKQVKRELILADQSDKAIIPMRLERIEPHALSYHLADSQWIDWIEQRDEAIDRIAAKAREFYLQSGGTLAAAKVPVADVSAWPSQPLPTGFQGNRPPPAQSYAPPAQPPYAPPLHSRPAANRKLMWVAGGGVLAIAIAVALIVFLSNRGPAAPAVRPLTAEFFAGTWSDTRDCREMFRFDRSGSVTDPDGQQGRWRVEDDNMLVVEGAAGTERRRVDIITDDHVTGPGGEGFRCFPGAT